MKTLLLIVIIFTFFSCEKEEIKPDKKRYLVKYEVDCSTSGFDVSFKNANSIGEHKYIYGTHWDTTFMNISCDTLLLGAIAKNVYSKLTGSVYYNDTLIHTNTCDNIDKRLNYCIISSGCVLK